MAPMLFRVAFLTVALTGALSATAVTGPASAAPGDPVLCNFTLSEPTVVEVSGVPMVSAQVTPAACTGTAKPTSTQVCLTKPGSAGRCAELPGYNEARVYLSPYQPGVTYTATGRGCAAQTNPPVPMCSTLGPKSATL